MFSDDLLFTTGCSAFVSSPGRGRRHWNLQSCSGRYIKHQHGTKVTKCKEIIKQKLLLFRHKGSNRRYFQSSKLPSRKTKALHSRLYFPALYLSCLTVKFTKLSLTSFSYSSFIFLKNLAYTEIIL